MNKHGEILEGLKVIRSVNEGSKKDHKGLPLGINLEKEKYLKVEGATDIQHVWSIGYNPSQALVVNNYGGETWGDAGYIYQKDGKWYSMKNIGNRKFETKSNDTKDEAVEQFSDTPNTKALSRIQDEVKKSGKCRVGTRTYTKDDF